MCRSALVTNVSISSLLPLPLKQLREKGVDPRKYREAFCPRTRDRVQRFGMGAKELRPAHFIPLI